MKKLTYLLLISVICIFIGFKIIPKQEAKNDIKTTETVRVIAYFDKNAFSGKTLINSISGIKSKSIQNLLSQFNVNELRAVFRNRYNVMGLPKPMLNKDGHHDDLEGWQEITLSGKSQASKLVNLLKEEKGVLCAYVEQPILLKPCTDDPNYYLQWHLNSTSNPLADIRVEQAWNINKGRSDVIIAVCIEEWTTPIQTSIPVIEAV